GEDRQISLGDRTPLAGLAHTGDDLLPAERLHHARPLDDVQARGLRGGEAPAALGALATPPDGESVVAGAGVDHTRVWVTAERAVHGV
ncbi:hypothetical protein ABE10_02825, partial [Bacillus toyonensis]|nr:hypothetical protein [Bacillus toyonensis]